MAPLRHTSSSENDMGKPCECNVQRSSLFSSICSHMCAAQSVYEERNIEMSSIMKPLEYNASPNSGHSTPPKEIATLVVDYPGDCSARMRSWRCARVELCGQPSPCRGAVLHRYQRIKTTPKPIASWGPKCRPGLSQQAFIQQAQLQDEALGRMTRYTEDNIPIGDPATITETVTRAHGSTYTVHLELRQEGGAWKITSFDRI